MLEDNSIQTLKALNKIDRARYLAEHKPELGFSDLDRVNGANGANQENPNSETPYKGNYYSSYGFICEGEVICE